MISLPIEDALPDLLAALGTHRRAVLQAPPGAGKTTKVPIALSHSGLADGKIIVLEPRRLAALAAAERMSQMLKSPLGGRVGYRMRGETKVSDATEIEVVTEGILTRMLQSDPELPGVGAVIFDEFHERSLNADLGLALCWEARQALREDLILLMMSATLDAAPVAELLDGAPVITSPGRSYPVETIWRMKPRPSGQRIDQDMADLVDQALNETEGGILAFLPGQREIAGVAARLRGRLPASVALHQLFGAAPSKDQKAAIAPERDGRRKLVLATAIAETSLTLADIHVVVDCGLARRGRFDPGSGMNSLVTERASRAEADQRRGRAGRLGPGVCYRSWAKAEEGAMPEFSPAEITMADLAGFALDLAIWGSSADALALLTSPPKRRLEDARALLQSLGALSPDGTVTAHGRRMGKWPVHPRLAHMLEIAGKPAAPLAAVLSGRDPLENAPVDLEMRLKALEDPERFAKERPYGLRRHDLHSIAKDAKRLTRDAKYPPAVMSNGAICALGYPDRIGLRRPGDAARWALSGARGATVRGDDPIAQAHMIVVTDMTGTEREARIRAAVSITEAELREVLGDSIGWQETCTWSRREQRVLARRQEKLGALVLDDRIWRHAPVDQIARALMEGVRLRGLDALQQPPTFRGLQARAEFAKAHGADIPGAREEDLLATLEEWLQPFANGAETLEALGRSDLTAALRGYFGWEGCREIDQLAPSDFQTPLGRRVPIDYAEARPSISVRLQEMFGLDTHPTVGVDKLALQVVLLSPAGRPVQITNDLPGFWRQSYRDVRKNMRGRYPKHPWPEDPLAAEPTLRTKRRP
ncbi:MAG: ATP-dependent helicase HrpB [Pseudomonadota bacterium]